MCQAPFVMLQGLPSREWQGRLVTAIHSAREGPLVLTNASPIASECTRPNVTGQGVRALLYAAHQRVRALYSCTTASSRLRQPERNVSVDRILRDRLRGRVCSCVLIQSVVAC